MELELPFPPAASRIAPAGRAPERNEAYRIWCHLALWQLAQQLDPPGSRLIGRRPVMLDIALARPTGQACSLSDLAPALEELLVAGGLLPARTLIDTLRLRWTNADPEAPRIAVRATKDVRRHLPGSFAWRGRSS